VDKGAADPGAIVVTGSGDLFIGSHGSGDILKGEESRFEFSQLAGGGRLTALVFSTNNNRLYAADASMDELLAFEVNSTNRPTRISLGPRRSMSEAETGEDLFYNARISHKGWLSCHSCHTDGHSNEALTDTLGDGNFGAPKRVLSLLGTAD